MGDIVEQGLGFFGDREDRKAAGNAAAAEINMSQAAIQEQRDALDEARQILGPYTNAGAQALGGYGQYAQAGQEGVDALRGYVGAGNQAFGQQQDIIGLRGPEAQQAQYDAILNSPQYQEMVRQGENALLQNASATGGLRGGNTQAALAQFRPQVMNQLMDQQYGRLGGITSTSGTVAGQLASSGQTAISDLSRLGQASAAGSAAQGSAAAGNIGNQLGNIGASQAGYALMPSGMGSFLGNQRAGYARDQGFVQGLIGTGVSAYAGGMAGGM
jgi:hypothetical protein